MILIARAVFNPKFPRFWVELWREKDFLLVFSIFFIFLISGLWSEDLGYFGARMRMKLPIIGMPIAFLAIRKFGKKELNYFLYFYFWVVVFAVIGTLIYAFLHWADTTDAYAQGQVIVTPAHHIRFSLLVVFAICVGWQFVWEKFIVKWKWERTLLIVFTLFLIGFLHFLAVRSGLFALYAVLLFYLSRWIVGNKKYALGLGIIAGALLLIWTAYSTIPTFKNKIDYTLYGLEQIQHGNQFSQYSDGKRLISMEAGWNLFAENPILGVGVGDIKNEMNNWFVTNYPELTDSGLLPHNQFMFVLAACGIFGFLWFVFASLFPFFYKKAYSDTLLMAFGIIIFSSFLTEHTIETQVGTAFFVFPLMMILRSKKDLE